MTNEDDGRQEVGMDKDPMLENTGAQKNKMAAHKVRKT